MPRLMGSVGHSRTFAICTAFGAIGLASHMILTGPYWWALFRVFSGICVAGCYTVIEAWLQAKVTNETRGRAMGSYRVVDITASLIAQFMIGGLALLESPVAYNLLTVICCASLLPLALTKAAQPATPAQTRLRPSMAWVSSPLAVAGVLVAALSSASFRMVGPIYGQEVGLGAGQIGLFLAAFVAGGAIAQWPAGWLADRYDRRWVLIGLSVASALSSLITIAITGWGTSGIMLSAAFFGFTSFPIFSVSAAHAHDFIDNDKRVELSAALMFWFAVGAIAAPLFASNLIANFGPSAMFWLLSAAHLTLVIYGLLRMRVRSTPDTRTRYIYAPRTSFLIGRLLGKSRNSKN